MYIAAILTPFSRFRINKNLEEELKQNGVHHTRTLRIILVIYLHIIM